MDPEKDPIAAAVQALVDSLGMPEPVRELLRNHLMTVVCEQARRWHWELFVLIGVDEAAQHLWRYKPRWTRDQTIARMRKPRSAYYSATRRALLDLLAKITTAEEGRVRDPQDTPDEEDQTLGGVAGPPPDPVITPDVAAVFRDASTFARVAQMLVSDQGPDLGLQPWLDKWRDTAAFMGKDIKRGSQRNRWVADAEQSDRRQRSWLAAYYKHEGMTHFVGDPEPPIAFRTSYETDLRAFRGSYWKAAGVLTDTVARHRDTDFDRRDRRPIPSEVHVPMHKTLGVPCEP